MPSFAKVNTAPENPLANLWKDHPNPAPVKDLLDDSRVRAAQILSTIIPAKIAHVRHLIDAEDDPSSLLWKGHVQGGDYVTPRMLQPDQLNAMVAAKNNFGTRLEHADLRVGEKILLPSDVTRDNQHGGGSDTPSSEMSEDTLIGEDRKFGSGTNVEKGVPVGPHWFEVVPRNKIQTDLIEMLVKEHEELNLLCVDLRMWLELEIPLIEDGNSFGAEVQNHLIREIEVAQKRSTSYHNCTRQHHTDRIKLAIDWTRYPNVMDYPAAIAHSDRFDHFLARSYLRQLLTTYGGLMTKFQRNWEKVINPKGEAGRSSAGMY